MKKTIFLLFVLLTLVLSACSGTAPAEISAEVTATEQVIADTPSANETSAEETSAAILNTGYENAVSIPLQLFWGTFRLFGTDQSVTKEQAAKLVPLWTEYETLVNSMRPSGAPGMPGQAGGQDQSGNTGQPASPDQTPAAPAQDTLPNGTAPETASNSEIDALVDQIMAAMTTGQLQVIAGIQITQETITAIMEEQSISMENIPQGSGNPLPGSQPPDMQSGQQAQGTLPAGNLGSAIQGTPPADVQNPQGSGQPFGGFGSGDRIPSNALDALILLLANTTGDASAIATAQTGVQTQSNPPAIPGSNGSNSTAVISGAFTLDGGTETKTGETFTADETDQSAIYVTHTGTLTLSNAAISTSGNTSSQDNSSFYGQNAAVLAENGSTIDLSDSTITTSGTGANGAFATGSGSSVHLTNVTINAVGDGGHGVMATQGGVMTLNDVNMYTSGKNSGAIATDRGSGTIEVTGGTVMTTGQDSPAIYSTGGISITGGTLSASGAEAAVIEGGNSINLTDTDLSSSLEKWGVMIYQSMSGDAEGTKGIFTMSGGSLAYSPAGGPMFYVTNSTGVITLKDVDLVSGSSILMNAAAGNWGNEGSNGGHILFTADAQTLSGNVTADKISTIDLTLQNGSALEGAINSNNTAGTVNLTLDSSSKWIVTADSYLTGLFDTDAISGTTISNIEGNGFTVYYNASACPKLGGLIFSLGGGGYLKPVG